MDRPLTKRPPPALLITHRTSHGHDANAYRHDRDTQGSRTYEAATYTVVGMHAVCARQRPMPKPNL